MNRFDIVLAHYVFCTQHHSGQNSELYQRLCRITAYFTPGAAFSETRFFDPAEADFEQAREVYQALCHKHNLPDPCNILIAVDRDDEYAPGCFLVCRVTNPAAGPGHYDWDTRDEDNTVLIQFDHQYPSLARAFGWDGDDSDLASAAVHLDSCVEEARVIEDPGYFDTESRD